MIYSDMCMTSDAAKRCDPSHTFVTSDHHFGSWKRNPCPWRPPVFLQADEESLIAKWNSVIKTGDLVIHIGDFCDSGVADLIEYRKRLNGSIVLVKGNHDDLPDDVYNAVFQGVHERLFIDELKLVFQHCPDAEGVADFRQIYGHEHIEGGQLHPMDPARSFCSCVMRNGGFPVALEAALAKMDATVCRASGGQS